MPTQDGNTPADADKVISELKAQIEDLTKMVKDFGSGLAGQRSIYDRQLNELRGQLKAAQAARSEGYSRDYGRGADSESVDNPRLKALEDSLEARRVRDEIRDFEFDHPDYRTDEKVKKSVLAILNDPSQVHRVLARNEEGKIDYTKTYRSAYLEVQNQTLKEAQAAAATAREQAEKERLQSKTEAALSGDVVEELPEGLTLEAIEAMSPEDMEKKGLVPGMSRRKPSVGV